MSYERYSPDYRYSPQQQNPLIREAAFIAQQMDSGNAELAGQRLREDLYQLQRSPEQAQQLVQLVQQYDRKGSGADLEIRIGRQNGFSVADASIVDYDYFRDGRTGRVERQQYNRDQICRILLPQNGGYNGQPYYSQNRDYDGGQPYYDPRRGYDPRAGYDPRTGFDPRAGYDPRAGFDPRTGFDPRDPRASYDRGSYYRSQNFASQFDPRDPSNWDPRTAWEANQRYRSTGGDPRQRYADQNFDPRDYASNDAWQDQNYQEGYTGYTPDWQRGYNPEPSAHLPRPQQRFDWQQQQEDWQQNYQAIRNRQRHPQSHGHSHTRQTDYSQPSTSRGVDISGLDQGAEVALERAAQMAARDGVKIQVTSGFRSHADQARLYAQLHGISPVAKPGTSSHETGEAIDVKNYSQAKPYLLAAGFVHGDGKGPIAGDPWHFRYMG